MTLPPNPAPVLSEPPPLPLVVSPRVPPPLVAPSVVGASVRYESLVPWAHAADRAAKRVTKGIDEFCMARVLASMLRGFRQLERAPSRLGAMAAPRGAALRPPSQ